MAAASRVPIFDAPSHLSRRPELSPFNICEEIVLSDLDPVEARKFRDQFAGLPLRSRTRDLEHHNHSLIG